MQSHRPDAALKEHVKDGTHELQLIQYEAREVSMTQSNQVKFSHYLNIFIPSCLTPYRLVGFNIVFVGVLQVLAAGNKKKGTQVL